MNKRKEGIINDVQKSQEYDIVSKIKPQDSLKPINRKESAKYSKILKGFKKNSAENDQEKTQLCMKTQLRLEFKDIHLNC